MYSNSLPKPHPNTSVQIHSKHELRKNFNTSHNAFVILGTLQNTKPSLQLHFWGKISLIPEEITELLQFDLNPARSCLFFTKI